MADENKADEEKPDASNNLTTAEEKPPEEMATESIHVMPMSDESKPAEEKPEATPEESPGEEKPGEKPEESKPEVSMADEQKATEEQPAESAHVTSAPIVRRPHKPVAMGKNALGEVPEVQSSALAEEKEVSAYEESEHGGPEIQGRALHYAFKIAERKRSIFFYNAVLGMQILRHEEYSRGCQLNCQGPYRNRWSKTVVGYGSEDDHFVIELTYIYPIKRYAPGNDLIAIVLRSTEVLNRAKAYNWPILAGNVLEAPGGYKYQIIEEAPPPGGDPMYKVQLPSSSLKRDQRYWVGVLGLHIFDETPNSIIFGYDAEQMKVELIEVREPIDHAGTFGRIAFSCPLDQQTAIEDNVKAANETIRMPLTDVEVPGSPNVRLLVIADPDGHEISFMDDEKYRQRSAADPEAEQVMNFFLERDWTEAEVKVGIDTKDAEDTAE